MGSNPPVDLHSYGNGWVSRLIIYMIFESSVTRKNSMGKPVFLGTAQVFRNTHIKISDVFKGGNHEKFTHGVALSPGNSIFRMILEALQLGMKFALSPFPKFRYVSSICLRQDHHIVTFVEFAPICTFLHRFAFGLHMLCITFPTGMTCRKPKNARINDFCLGLFFTLHKIGLHDAM